jgi:hypothetical protein
VITATLSKEDFKMKKYYGSPEYEIDIFNISNVITTSGDDGGLGDGDNKFDDENFDENGKIY